MEIKELQDRITKKEAQIEKIKKKIEKIEAKNNQEGYIKEYAAWYSDKPKTITTLDQLYRARANWVNEPLDQAKAWFRRAEEDYYKEVANDLRRATRELEDAQSQLDKYNKQLNKESEKENVEMIPIIAEFLENWKRLALEDIKENVKDAEAYYEYRASRQSMINSDEYTYEKSKQMRKVEEELKSRVIPLTLMHYNPRTEELDIDGVEKDLDKDVKAKYQNLVNKVKSVIGEIKDASNLRVANDGNLNGYVIGENGKARVETIMAGGYNAGQIVNVKKGQVLHFRVLVHKVK